MFLWGSITDGMMNTALDDERLQVITNQIYAQIVPHVGTDSADAQALP